MLRRFKLLDLFCGAGGCTRGYQQAGFWVRGVDLKPQLRYVGEEFVQADALEYLGGLIASGEIAEFDAIHASPPCQAYTRMSQGLLKSQGKQKVHPDLVSATRELIKQSDLPYVIENVEGAPLLQPLRLCGSSFGLLVQRHRLFECSFFALTLKCQHRNYVADKPPLHRLQGVSRVVGCYGNGRGKGDNVKLWQRAMGIDWMTRRELSQAIPPAYTEFIGQYLLAAISEIKRAA